MQGSSLLSPVALEEILPPPPPNCCQATRGDMPVPGPENSEKAALCTLHNELHGKRELAGAGYLERVR